MARLDKCLSIFFVFLLLSSTAFQLTVKAQSSISQTLGPITVLKQGDGGTSVQIITPQNQSSRVNPITVVFCVKASLLPYCYSTVGDTGYSIDGGPVYRVTDFVNETIIREVYGDKATVWGNVSLPDLSEGSHNVTVYWGWYFEGENQRFEVLAYETVDFFIISQSPSPSPTVPEFSSLLVIPLLLSVLAVAFMVRKKQVSNRIANMR